MSDYAKPPLNFWKLLGIALGIGGVLSVVILIGFIRAFTTVDISNATCTSATLLALATMIPMLADMGRGAGRFLWMKDRQAFRKALDDERRQRERGMVLTFALAAAAVLLGLLSIVMALL